jgi:hypothetical protein
MKFTKMFVLFSLLLLFVINAVAYAADAVAPGLGESVGALIASITTKAPFAVVLVAVFQILRTNEVLPILGKLTGRYMQVAIAILTSAGYIVSAVVSGKAWGPAAIEGLFTAGGAMVIYDAFRNIPKA